MSEEVIALNRMYAGTYLEDHIGHEIINLFKADNDKHYIYLNPYGTLDKKYFEGDNTCKIKTLLMVRQHGKQTFEILAKATGLETSINLVNPKDNDILNKQLEEAKEITYGEVKISDIFNPSKDGTKVFYTFKAAEVLRPEEPIYITTNEIFRDSDSKNIIYLNSEQIEDNEENNIFHLSKSSLRMFISNTGKQKGVYKKLSEKMNEKEFWQNGKGVKKINIDKRNDNVAQKSLMQIIRGDKLELLYSNFFKYIFDSNKDGFKKFCENLFGVKNVSDEYIIEREVENIDLLIEYGNNVIVIENKIKSDINGVKKDSKSNQLTKYYNIAKKKYKDKNRCFFIFAPDYNPIKYKCKKDEENKESPLKYCCLDESGEVIKDAEYTLIPYSEINKWFVENKKFYSNVPYFDEFLKALALHTREFDDTQEREMFRRFYSLLLSKKQK